MRTGILLASLLLLSGCQCPTGLEPIYYVEVSDIAESGPAKMEFTFSRDSSECVNGSVSRGFAYQTIEVTDPRLNGQPMRPERVQKRGREYVHYVPSEEPRFAHYQVTFTIDDRVYETDYQKAEVLTGMLRIHTKPKSTEQK